MDKLMKKIKEIVFSDAKEADVKRENGNIDGNTSMGMMLHLGSTVSKEFCLENMMNKEFSEAHKNGDIHIHDMDFMTMGTTTCSQLDLKKLFEGGFSTGHGYLREPNSIISYSALSAIALQSNQNDQHGGQSIPAYDYYMREGVIKTFRRKLKENIARYLEIRYEYGDKIFETMSNKIIEEFGEIKSIELTEEEKNTLLSIVRDVIYRGFYSIDGIAESIQSRSMVNFILKQALKETERETYQAMEALIHNLNTMHSRAGAQVPFTSINFGTDTTPEGRMVSRNLLLAHEAGLGHGETPIFPILIFKVKSGINLNPGDVNYDLFKLAIRVSSKRLFPNFAFLDAPYNLQYYVPGRPETEIAYMGCRTRIMSDVNGDNVVAGRGNISFTTINLVRIALECNKDLTKFYDILDNKIDLVIKQLFERFDIQCKKKVKNFPFLMGQGIWNGSENLDSEDTLYEAIKHGSLSVGFIGLAETLVALTGKHHGESEGAQALGLGIIEYMRNRMDEATEEYKLNFTLLATPAEGLSGRFTGIDREKYGVIKGVTDRDYYTNSFHVPVYYNTTAIKKIQLEAPYHNLTNAGHISYIELDGAMSKNLEAFEQIVRFMSLSGIGYGSINHPIDRCVDCGYQGIIDDDCPVCKSKRIDRIRRITGYLVGTLDRFNNGKRAEEKDRVKHGMKK